MAAETELSDMFKKFSLYHETDRLECTIDKDEIRFSYVTIPTTKKGDTQIQLIIKNNTCEILWFSVAEQLRGKGYARELYYIVESYCKKHHIPIEVGPVSANIDFFRKMGFSDAKEDHVSRKEF